MTEPTKTPKFKRLVHGEAMDEATRQRQFRDKVKKQGGSDLSTPLSPEATSALQTLLELDDALGVRGAKRKAVEAALINEAARRLKAAKR